MINMKMIYSPLDPVAPVDPVAPMLPTTRKHHAELHHHKKQVKRQRAGNPHDQNAVYIVHT